MWESARTRGGGVECLTRKRRDRRVPHATITRDFWGCSHARARDGSMCQLAHPLSAVFTRARAERKVHQLTQLDPRAFTRARAERTTVGVPNVADLRSKTDLYPHQLDRTRKIPHRETRFPAA